MPDQPSTDPAPSRKPIRLRLEVFFIRRPYGRLICIVASIVLVNVLLLTDVESSTDDLRQAAFRSLQGVSLIFTIVATVSLALFLSYVKGTRDAYWNKVGQVRDLLGETLDALPPPQPPSTVALITKVLDPLLAMGHPHWNSIETYKDWLEPLQEDFEILNGVMRENPQILPRYLARLEEEIFELSLLYFTRAKALIHLNNLTGAFLLVVVVMVTIAVAHLAPSTVTADVVIFNLCIALITMAALELLLLLSFMRQEGRDEMDFETGEVPSTRTAFSLADKDPK